jgi:uncharacterized protein DUF2523
MTWIVSFFGALASAAFIRPFLTRVVIALGFSLVTFAGVSVGVNAATALIVSNWAGLPSDVVGVLELMKIPDAINVILSAWVGALGVKGLTAAGQLKRAVWRPGQSGDLFGAG